MKALLILMLAHITFAQITTVSVDTQLKNPKLKKIVENASFAYLANKLDDHQHFLLLTKVSDQRIVKIKKDGRKTVGLTVRARAKAQLMTRARTGRSQQIQALCTVSLKKQTNGSYKKVRTSCKINPPSTQVATMSEIAEKIGEYFSEEDVLGAEFKPMKVSEIPATMKKAIDFAVQWRQDPRNVPHFDQAYKVVDKKTGTLIGYVATIHDSINHPLWDGSGLTLYFDIKLKQVASTSWEG